MRPLELINKAERPVILAGHGIMLSGAMHDLLALAETQRHSRGPDAAGLGRTPAFHPLSLGMMGMHGEAWVNHAIQDADLLIALGMRFDDRVTGKLDSYAPRREEDPRGDRRVGDPQERAGGCGHCGRPEAGAAAAHAAHRPRDALRMAGRTSTTPRATVAVRDIQNLSDTGHLYAAHVINDLWRETEGNALIVTDVGQHQMWEAQYYHHSDPRSLITSGGLGTMGFALPAAIGAKFARPDAEVWVIVGDGGFQMTMAELATLVQEGIKVNIAIINNGYLGHGAPVAGVLLRAQLRGHAAGES